jgi:hypothetical protein
MKERPILYNGPMVRACLAKTKRQTRRVMKPQPSSVDELGRWYRMSSGGESLNCYSCPYGQKGDRLWVRETWSHDAPDLDTCRRGHESDGTFYGPYYKATASRFELTSLRWRPSIHMPRWASRITQTITEVRVERVQDISEADALAEGVMEWAAVHCSRNPEDELYPRAYFELLWNSINKGAYAWDVNPRVWVISFEVSEQ